MPTLHEHLLNLPHRDLRAVATRLGVRTRAQSGRAAWLTAVTEAWQDPARRAALLAQLSPAAHAAAHRLAQAGELPAALFFAEYGAIRRVAPGRHWQPAPWDAPQSVSEELYYAGLLCPVPLAAIERAPRLALAADLQLLFAAPSAAPRAPAAAPRQDGAPAAVLLHDVAQFLCYLLAQPDLTLLHGRWLPPAHLSALNRRLLQPDPTPRPRSHKRLPRLRFYAFLAAAAGLTQGADVTPTGWAWLALPPAQRLGQLWQAWRRAPTSLRLAYAQAEAALPAPWPGLLLDHLGQQSAPCTAGALAASLLGQTAIYTTYFAAHLPDLAALDCHVAELLAGALLAWGVVTPAPPAPGEPPAYILTDTGRWLLAAAPDELPRPAWLATTTTAGARLTCPAPATWQIAVPSSAPPHPQAVLSLYATHQQLLWPANPPCHHYHITETTIAAASAAGHELPALLAALADLGLTLAPEQVAQLGAWHARGRELRLVTLPLLQATSPELMARLHNDAAIRAGLGDLLAPTVAVAALPSADLAARLRAAGFFPQETGDRDQAAGIRRQGSGSKPADGAANPQSAIRNLKTLAALWLAGQLYAALGQHLALPLPPPFAGLDALLAAQPAADQAALQAQWATLRADLAGLLDGRTFAPPAAPSDPATWRPHIEAAIAAGHPITLTYFTAGRNVLTQRTVTPYWIEEHRGVLYLRADCHLAGRVRLFRLDRIQALQESGVRNQSLVPSP